MVFVFVIYPIFCGEGFRKAPLTFVPLCPIFTDMQRIFPPLVQALQALLIEIFVHGRQADKALEYAFKHQKKWGARDRAFLAENTYEMVRWYRLLGFLLGKEYPNFPADTLPAIATWLWVKKYEVQEIQRIFPPFSAEGLLERWEAAQKIRSVAESIPTWLDQIGSSELGDEVWQAELHAMNQPAPVFIRVNTLKATLSDLTRSLAESGIQAFPVPGVLGALRIEERAQLFKTPAFQLGWFEVQDAGSQCIGQFVEAQPGMRIVDACAGAGGKSLQLATLMQNKGKIIALDVEEWKLQELKRRAKRQDIQTIETRLIDPKTIKRLKGSADRLLLDVPCSGLGVLRRNPDSKWKLSPDFLAEIKQTQAYILQEYSSILKPSGKIIYATCSILPSESEDQVKQFLIKNPSFELESEYRTSPAQDGFDGFYMAKLVQHA